MLDTLMVLWTRGNCLRFIRSVFFFFALFISICLLLFFVTNSDVKWPGLAFTASSETSAASTSTNDVSASTPTPVAFSIPVILQNPTVASKVVLPVTTPQVLATAPAMHKFTPVRRSRPKPFAKSKLTPLEKLIPTPELPKQPSINDWLSDAISANGHLAGGLVDSPSELESLFWPALIAMLLTVGGCIAIFLVIHHKRHFQA